MRLSIVIPAYNEEKNLGKSLESLCAQDTTESFEVIVVDNNSTDRTAEVARSFSKNLAIKVIKQTIKGRGPARKKGFDEALGEIIFSTDADSTVSPDWIRTYLEYFKDKKVVAVTSLPCIVEYSSLKNKCFSFLVHLTMYVYRFLFGHYWLSGFSFAIRKDIYISSGGFDAELNFAEDLDLGFKVHALGGSIAWNKKARVVFSGRRFKTSILGGSLPYFTSFFQYYVGNKQKSFLSDIR